MPRKAKEKEIVIEQKNIVEKSVKDEENVAKAKKTTRKSKTASAVSNTTTKKSKSASVDSKTTAKKSKSASADSKTTAKKSKSASTDSKTTAKKSKSASADSKTTAKESKSASADSKTTTKKSRSTSSDSKTTTKKSKSTSASSKTTAKKSKSTSTSSKTTTKRKSKVAEKDNKKDDELKILEYYDLPYKYGNTLVKLLAQTPKTLFIYWEISDLDIENYKQQFGEEFFNVTKPILIVHNLTLNKTYEVEINDFANCWYLTTEDADCKFDIELARKFVGSTVSNQSQNLEYEQQNQQKQQNYQNQHNLVLKNNYLCIAKSNNLQSPNDHILFEKLSNFITFKNTETGELIRKNIKSYAFLNNLYKFYKDMYNDEILKNPSSNFNI